MHDNLAAIKAMAAYFESPPAVTVLGERFGLIGKAQYKKKMVYGGVDASAQEKTFKLPKAKKSV